MQILVVADEATQARVLRAALQKRGHPVTVARDGAGAGKKVQQDYFSPVISDWLMPRRDPRKTFQARKISTKPPSVFR